MKRSLIFVSILFLGIFFIMADAVSITIVSPNGGHPLIKNQTETITWTHSSHFNGSPQTCRLYFGGHAISPPIPVVACSFTWTNGLKADGTYIPQGRYKLTLQSPDYDVLNGPDVYLVDEDDWINITGPADNSEWVRGKTCTITWTPSAYYQVFNTQPCAIFCGTHFISPPVPVLDGSFTWTVGKKRDGTWLPPGQYKITLESWDYDALNGPNITIKISDFTTMEPFLRRFEVREIPIYPIPQCPMCFKINPEELNFNRQKLKEPVTMEILRGDKVLAKLGEFGPRRALPGPVKIKFTKQEFRLIKNHKAGFKLRIRSAKGKILKEKNIQLVPVKR